MSSEFAIRVNGLGKSFPVYHKPYHRLLQMVSPGPKQRWFKEFQALKDIDFTVPRGQTLGIVGRNGSGKSTLLQLICGTLTPSAGSVEVNGRVAALLELGAGFNPEFTGRENIFLNGAVLGLSTEEIRRRFDDIVAFAEIGDFIEQPVKSYSSGMYVRLAFAVAIHVDPEILIIDEALSVGDEAFQRKCFARINRIKEAGATVLFVSHSAGTVTELCDRAILLDHGELLAQGSPKFVVSNYHKMLYAPAERVESIRGSIRSATEGQWLGSHAPHPDTRANGVEANGFAGEAVGELADEDLDAYFDEGLVSKSVISYEAIGASIENAHIETMAGRKVNVLKAGNRYVYTYDVHFHAAAAAVRFGMLIKTITGVEIGGAQSATREDALPVVESGAVLNVRYEFRCMVAPGSYFLNAGVLGSVGEAEVYLNRQIDIGMFRVMPDPRRLATALVDFDVRPVITRSGVEREPQ